MRFTAPSTLAALSLAASLIFTACSCDEPQPTGTCATSRDCVGGAVCADGRCVEPHDAALPPGEDAPFTPATDAAAIDAATDAPVDLCACQPAEVCFNGVDDDCNGEIDENCGCVPGTTTRCLPGRADTPTSRCSWGEMTCVGEGEFGEWGPCEGAFEDDGSGSIYGCRRIGIIGGPGANPSANFQSWLETQGAIVSRIQTSVDEGPLRIEALETFDLVIIDWLPRDYTTEEADTLAGWIRGGGALFSMVGHDSAGTAHRQISLLASLGPNYDLSGGVLSGPATLVPHPTTRDEDGTSTLPPVSFYGGLRVSVPEAMAATFLPIARIGDDVVGAAGPIGEGFALLFGDEWIEFDSEWSTLPAIPRFWRNSVEWLAPDRSITMCSP